MNSSLVMRPRLAIATALAIVAAVGIIAAFFPNASVAEIPKRGNTLEDLYGRKFDAVNATEGDRPYELPDDWPTSVTFDLAGRVRIEAACGDLEGIWRLDENRFAWRKQAPYFLASCNRATQPHADWLTAFMTAQPTWRLAGNTFELRSDFGTMTMVDKGEGTTPSEILGKRFHGHPYQSVDKAGQPRIRGNTWLSLSFDPDGTMRAKLGCESVVVPTEVRTGWFRITAKLRRERTTDCSRGMAAQDTAWLWDFLEHPVQWQAHRDQWLMLKAYQSDQEPLGVSRVYEREERLTDPALLAGRTFYAAPNSAFSNNLGGYRGIVIKVGDDGEFTATAGCEQPSVHGRFRTGWVQFGENLEWSLSACEGVEAEQWLGDFLAHEPAWYAYRNGGLTLDGTREPIEFADAEDYEKKFGVPPPSAVGGN